MHYLSYVVGEKPDETLKVWKDILWDWYVVGGRWGHLSQRPRSKLPVPYHLFYENGWPISRSTVGPDGMKEAFRALDPADPITIVDLHF